MDDLIDAHVHFQLRSTTSVGGDFSHSRDELLALMDANRIAHVVSPTTYRPGLDTTAIIEEEYLASAAHPRITLLGGINPHLADRDAVLRANEYLARGQLGGLKVYLGYYHVPITDERYAPFFELAAQHGVPVLVHTGDTYYKTGKLRYSHPLGVDDVAVDFPDTRFVIAHMGNPWLTDAAAVAYKNDNVFLDTSALMTGDAYPDFVERQFKEAYAYVDDPRKFLYGTDWPVCGMPESVAFFRRVIPQDHQSLFFAHNAREVYNISPTPGDSALPFVGGEDDLARMG